jgi:hypothetical protein
LADVLPLSAMKKILVFLFFVPCFCLAQVKSVPVNAEVIKLKKYNLENEIKDGKLSFLKGCFWTEVVQAKGRIISTTHVKAEDLVGRWGIIYLDNIKKKNPDGSFTLLPPKKLIIE